MIMLSVYNCSMTLTGLNLFAIEVYDYETEMLRIVAEFETLDAAVDMADNGYDGRLMAACLAIDPCFTLGEHHVIDYRGQIRWTLEDGIIADAYDQL